MLLVIAMRAATNPLSYLMLFSAAIDDQGNLGKLFQVMIMMFVLSGFGVALTWQLNNFLYKSYTSLVCSFTFGLILLLAGKPTGTAAFAILFLVNAYNIFFSKTPPSHLSSKDPRSELLGGAYISYDYKSSNKENK